MELRAPERPSRRMTEGGREDAIFRYTEDNSGHNPVFDPQEQTFWPVYAPT